MVNLSSFGHGWMCDWRMLGGQEETILCFGIREYIIILYSKPASSGSCIERLPIDKPAVLVFPEQ